MSRPYSRVLYFSGTIMHNPHKTPSIFVPSPQGTLDYLFDSTNDSRAYSVRSRGIHANSLLLLDSILQ